MILLYKFSKKTQLLLCLFLAMSFNSFGQATTPLVANAAPAAGTTVDDDFAFGMCGTNYATGADREKVYTYTATADLPCARINLDPETQYTGVFVFEGALPTSDTDVCLASAFQNSSGGTDPVSADFPITNGTIYYFIVTTDFENSVNFTIDLDVFAVATPNVIMSNASVTIAEGTSTLFYDTGGPSCNYQKDEDLTLTVCPDAAGLAADKIVQLSFTAYDVNNTCDPFLDMRLYKGTAATAGQEIFPDGDYINISFEQDVRVFTAITADGCMTIKWDAADQINCEGAGWEGNFILVDSPCATTTMSDECAGAPALLSGASLSGTTECFTGGLSACGIGFQNNGWFKFTADAATANIDYVVTGGNACYEANNTANNNADDELPNNNNTGVQLLLYDGCGANDEICTAQYVTGGIDVANNVNASGTWTIPSLTIGNEYYVMFDGFASDLCDFSVTGAAGVSLLPIELLSFKAIEKGTMNELIWQTASEENTEWHIVERSSNGQDFVEIDRTKAAGSSFQIIDYFFMDKNPLTTSYYRIKTIDFDGYTGYSPIENVKRKGTGLNTTIFPNPVKNTLTVQLENDRASETTFTLTNVIGAIVFIKKESTDKGSQLVEVDVADLPKGVYVLTIENAVSAVSHKVMKD